MEQVSQLGTSTLLVVFAIFVSIAVLGIAYSFIDTVIRYVKKGTLMLSNTDIGSRVTVMEKDICQIKKDIRELKDKTK